MKRKSSSLDDWLKSSKSKPYDDAYYYYGGEPDIYSEPDFGSNLSGDETQEERDGEQGNDDDVEGDNRDQVQGEDIVQENRHREKIPNDLSEKGGTILQPLLKNFPGTIYSTPNPRTGGVTNKIRRMNASWSNGTASLNIVCKTMHCFVTIADILGRVIPCLQNMAIATGKTCHLLSRSTQRVASTISM